MTLQEAFDLYIKTRGERLKPKTIKGYTTTLRLHAGPFRDRDITSFTRDEVLAHYNKLASESLSVGKRFVQNCSAVVEFYIAWQDGPAFKNVFQSVKKLKLIQQVPKRTRHLNEHTLPTLFSSLPLISRDKQVLLLLLLYTGCRQKEIGDLIWSEVDLERGTLTIPGHRRKVNFDHRVVLSEVPLSMLKKYWNEQGQPRGAKRVFYHSASKGYKEILDKTGIDCRCHDLRRTFCSVAGGLSIPDVITKKLAGHTVSDITAQYISVLDVDAREYNRKIVAKLHELGGVKVETNEGKPRLKMSLDHAKTAATMTVTLDIWSTQNAAVY